jgi:hypothetical protein
VTDIVLVVHILTRLPLSSCFGFEQVGDYPKRKITAVHNSNLHADAKQRLQIADPGTKTKQGQVRSFKEKPIVFFLIMTFRKERLNPMQPRQNMQDIIDVV